MPEIKSGQLWLLEPPHLGNRIRILLILDQVARDEWQDPVDSRWNVIVYIFSPKAPILMKRQWFSRRNATAICEHYTLLSE